MSLAENLRRPETRPMLIEAVQGLHDKTRQGMDELHAMRERVTAAHSDFSVALDLIGKEDFVGAADAMRCGISVMDDDLIDCIGALLEQRRHRSGSDENGEPR